MTRDHGTETSLTATESKPRLFQNLQEECHPGELFWTFSNFNCKTLCVCCLNHYICGDVLQLSWGTDAEGRTVKPCSSSKEGRHIQASAVGKNRGIFTQPHCLVQAQEASLIEHRVAEQALVPS